MSEYGITVRWDKNFLTLLHLTLARRRQAADATAASASAARCRSRTRGSYGFDHVAIAAGAGRPTIIDMKNNLIRGIRKASDFLMALQLTGAFKRDALPNLQARLPAVVIGGGLTAHRHRDRADGVLPAAGREDARAATRRWSRELGEARVRALLRRRGARGARRVPARTAARSAPSARARAAAGEPPDFVAAGASLGRRDASRIASGWSIRRPTG